MITIRNGIAYQKKEYQCGKDHRCIVFDFIILVNWQEIRSDRGPIIYCKDSLLNNQLETLPSLSNYSQEIQDEYKKEDFISANMFLFSKIASDLKLDPNDYLNLVVFIFTIQ